MSLLDKISTTTKGRNIGSEMLHKLFLAINDDDAQAAIASFRADLETVDNSEDTFVFGRIKAPISSSRKFSENEKYQVAWNRIKDLLAYTIVVDGNNDKVDKIRKILVKKYEDLGMKNPNADSIYEDYMRGTVRSDAMSKAMYVYQDPTGRFYQTNDGYKNVKLNIMLEDFPVELQIKTRQQYIAHCCTHDAIYKAPKHLFASETIEGQADPRHMISDKMFPYFEANAYLYLYRDKLSPEEIQEVRSDIKDIYRRNFQIYNKYAPIFNEARADFGVYLYHLIYRKEFEEMAQGSAPLLLDFSHYRTKQVFKYLLKEVKNEDDSLTNNEAVSRTVDKLIAMPFEEYKDLTEKLRGQYRLPGCILTGAFDGLTPEFIQTIKAANEIFKSIHIKLYDDEFAQAITGKQPVFSLAQRQYMTESCKYVTSASPIIDFKSRPVESLSIDEVEKEEAQRPYAITSLTGVMDGCTPGHIKLAKYASSITQVDGRVVAGIKSDDYVRRVKNKSPIVSQRDRAAVYAGLRGVDEVYITDNDIKPSEEICRAMTEAVARGERCAIVTGSDWSNPEKLAQKPESSRIEYEWIKQNLPGVDVIPAPKRGGKEDFTTQDGQPMSSTVLRAALAEKAEPINMPIEISEANELEE